MNIGSLKIWASIDGSVSTIQTTEGLSLGPLLKIGLIKEDAVSVLMPSSGFCEAIMAGSSEGRREDSTLSTCILGHRGDSSLS